MNDDFNLDLTEVEKAAVAEQNTNVPATEEDDDNVGHKVVFYIVMALLGLSGVGIPVLIWLLVKKSKKLKQVQKELDAAKATKPETAPVETKTEETKSEETKEPETK